MTLLVTSAKSVGWLWTDFNITRSANLPWSKGVFHLYREEMLDRMLQLVSRQMEMPHLPFWLSSIHGQQTCIYYGWGPGSMLKSFYSIFGCSFTLLIHVICLYFYLLKALKKLTQTAVQTPLFFNVAKVKKVWTAVSVKQIQVASLRQSFYKICKIMFLFSELLYFFFITLLL